MARINWDDPSLKKIANPSARTIAERNKFANTIDEFATFSWCGYDMFANFGAFIINDKKGSLKMYNGASYKNTYSKPQFQDGYTNLSGVTFDTQTISFTIGVYWISIEDYRVLMNLLHPYEVNTLTFGFEKTYGYFCKLQSIKDSTRYILGKETLSSQDAATTSGNLNYSRLEGGNDEGYRYYTELSLTFDVIGPQCAQEITPQIIEINSSELNEIILETYVSDLDYPITIVVPSIKRANENEDGAGTLMLQATISYPIDEPTVVNTNTLFAIGLKSIGEDPISISYNSEHGLVYWSVGDKSQILTLLSTNTNGQRIISSLQVNQFYWPGRLTLPSVGSCKFTLQLKLSGNLTFQATSEDTVAMCEYSRRTNVL